MDTQQQRQQTPPTNEERLLQFYGITSEIYPAEQEHLDIGWTSYFFGLLDLIDDLNQNPKHYPDHMLPLQVGLLRCTTYIIEITHALRGEVDNKQEIESHLTFFKILQATIYLELLTAAQILHQKYPPPSSTEFVKDILEHKGTLGTPSCKYKVRWKYCEIYDHSWLKEDSFVNRDILDDYISRNRNI